MPTRCKHVHTVRRRLADDRIETHRYFRPSGERLLGAPGTEEFRVSYLVAKRNHERRQKLRSGAESEVRQHIQPMTPIATDQEAARKDLLTVEEVVDRYRRLISLGTLRNWRALRIGPSFVKVGRAVLYPKRVLDEWDKANTVICDAPKLAPDDEP